MRRYLALYWLFFKNRIKILLEYRANFIIGAISTIVQQSASLLAVWVVMRQIPALDGWKLAEIWLIYGLITLGQSLNHMFADNLWTLGWAYVRSGMFDRLMVRPINPLFHLLADRFNHDGLGHFAVGLFLVINAYLTLGLDWSYGTVLYIALAAISGGMIFFSLHLITSVSSFWIMDSIPVTRVVFEMHEFAKYPLSIYPNVVRVLLTFFIPFGLASYYPAGFVLEHNVPPYLAFAGPVAAVVLFIIGYRVWLFGLKHYGSTGS